MSGQSRRSPRGRAFFLSALLWAASLAGLQGPALAAGEAARTLVPVGHTIGIKLFSEGVVVVGLAEVETGGGLSAPGAACGLQVGDVITSIDGTALESEAVLRSMINEKKPGDTVELEVYRPSTNNTLTITLELSESTGS